MSDGFKRLIEMRSDGVRERRLATTAAKAARSSRPSRDVPKPAEKGVATAPINARELDNDSVRAEMARRGLDTSSYTWIVQPHRPRLDPAILEAQARDAAAQQAADLEQAKVIAASRIDARTASLNELGEGLRALGLDADGLAGGFRPVELTHPSGSIPPDHLSERRGFELAAAASIKGRLQAGEHVDARRLTTIELEALRRARGLDPR